MDRYCTSCTDIFVFHCKLYCCIADSSCVKESFELNPSWNPSICDKYLQKYNFKEYLPTERCSGRIRRLFGQISEAYCILVRQITKTWTLTCGTKCGCKRIT